MILTPGQLDATKPGSALQVHSYDEVEQKRLACLRDRELAEGLLATWCLHGVRQSAGEANARPGAQLSTGDQDVPRLCRAHVHLYEHTGSNIEDDEQADFGEARAAFPPEPSCCERRCRHARLRGSGQDRRRSGHPMTQP